MTRAMNDASNNTAMQPALPPRAGVGFKPEHFDAILRDEAAPAFFEIHAENYMGDGGGAHARLNALRDRFALSFHGVGLSIGGMRELDRNHLKRLRILCDRYQPESFSEHLAWSSHGMNFYNDLLPLPYNDETLTRVIAHIDETQDRLQRRMLLENPATYLQFATSEIPETDFIAEVAIRTGCGLLLDINNVFVSSINHGFDARDYLRAFPLERVQEIHLAGHDVAQDDEADHNAPLLIDAHGSKVEGPVWDLYRETIAMTGALPTLIEWDNNIPSWSVLRDEAAQADVILQRCRRAAA